MNNVWLHTYPSSFSCVHFWPVIQFLLNKQREHVSLMHYGLAFALVIPFSQFTLQENKDNTQGKNRRHNNYLGWRKKLRKCLHTLTSTLPTTPASSMVSLKAACSMDSSVSQPPWGQTTHTCQQQHQKGLKINKNWVSKQYKMWRSKQYLWELHSMTLLSTNHKNL